MREKNNKGFWDRWAKRYDFAMSGNGRIYAQIVDRMKKVLNREMTVLELACGTGLLSVRIAGSVKLVEATDFSEEMIRQVKAKAHSSRLHFSVQDATNLPYISGTFDAVVISPRTLQGQQAQGLLWQSHAHSAEQWLRRPGKRHRHIT